MSHSVFGWDLPPGCSHADIERVFGDSLPPCCDDCLIEDCDHPEECEKYQKATKDSEIEIPEDEYPH